MFDDKPIDRADQDRLGRARFADTIAAELTDRPSIVAAVIGPWGSGKTSVLHLVQSQLAAAQNTLVIEFNPWFFSGTEQLIQHFFSEFAAQLRSKDEAKREALAQRLDSYSRVLEPISDAPLVGGPLKTLRGALGLGSRVARVGGRFGQESLSAERAALEKALVESELRFVVVVDDIDRLQTEEIRDVVRLVRLVGSMPRTTYLLAFDRQRVETALGGTDPQLGRDYLEKIVLVMYQLPQISQAELVRLTLDALVSALEGLDARPIDQRYWANVVNRVVAPLIRTPRDATRYANAVPSAIRAVGTEVNLADLLTLEAIRVLQPGVFDRLPALVDPLTSTRVGFGGAYDDSTRRRETYRPQLEALVGMAGEKADAIRELLALVFPASQGITGNHFYGSDSAQAWRRERRVAHPEVFALYFARTLPDGAIETAVVESIFSAFADARQLDDLLTGLPNDRIVTLLDRLEDFEPDYPDDPTAAIVALDNLFPRLPTLERREMFGFDARMRVDRVLLRLLRKVDPEARRDAILQDAYPQLRSLSGKLWLLFLAGHRASIGHELIGQQIEGELLARLRQDIRDSDAAILAGERDLLRLLDLLRETEDPGDEAVLRELLGNDELLLGTLRSSLSENISSTMGDVTVQRESVLAAWSWLEALLGTATLGERVAHLPIPSNPDPATLETLRTALRYAEGWRPESFDRRRSDDRETEDADVGAAQ